MIGLLLLAVLAVAARDSLTPGPSPAAPDSVGARSAAPFAGARDSVLLLPEVRVRAPRVPAALRRMPTVFVRELDAAHQLQAVRSLPELLARAPGVRVLDYGGLGAFSTISLRGSAPDQVAVLLDGVPLTGAARGVVNLADLPATAIERVEVYPYAAPLAWGAALPAGAVNFVTAADAGLRALRVARGSFGTWETAGGAGWGGPMASAVVHAGYQGSRGDFRYLDTHGTPFEPGDDAERTRANDRFDAFAGLASLRARRGAWFARAHEDLLRHAQGLPGLGAVPALHARLSMLQSLTVLDAGRDPSADWPGVELEAGMDRQRSRFQDLGLPDRGELGGTRHDTDDMIGAERGRVAAVESWRAWRLEGEADVRAEHARLADAADGLPDPAPSWRHAHGASGTLRWSPWRGRITLQGARRWERVTDRLHPAGLGVPAIVVAREVATPQLGARVALPAGCELRGNATDAERVPDFTELFGNQGTVSANPRLRPERVRSADAGLAWHGARGAWRASGSWAHFGSRARDLVLWWKNSPNTVQALNVLSARITGDELAWAAATPGGFELSASGTWQDARNTAAVPAYAAGKALPLRPRALVSAALAWRHGPLALSADLQHLGADALDPANRQRVPARTLTGATLAWAWGADAADAPAADAPAARSLTVMFEVRNLGDVRASDLGGFPLPGRSVFVALEARHSRSQDSAP
ncbi:MAG TPA: TonB-dependent receptor [Candidatus Eisenbacteria bacterium]|nr:TonB-dependent receptor [Candidatus Eisenbacteria bacterium]